MTIICRVAATASGNSGLLCAAKAHTIRQYEYGTHEEGSYEEPRFLVRVVANADTSAIDALFGRGVPRVQQVGLRLYRNGYFSGGGNNGLGSIVDGTRCDRDISGWQVTTSIDTSIQKANVTVPLDHRGRSPFGSPLEYGAPVPGLDAIHFLLAYKLPETAANRYREYPILLYGIADDSNRDGATSDQLAFLSNMARYVKTPMTLRYPAGHGLTYAMMIQAICNLYPNGQVEAPDLPQYKIPGLVGGVPVFNNFQDAFDDIPMRKPVTLDRGDWLSLAKAIGAVLGIKLFENHYGLLEGAFVRPELGTPARIEGVISEADIVRSVNGSKVPLPQIGVSPTAPTHVHLTGSRQITHADGSSHKVFNLSSESTANVALEVEPFFQQSLGSTISSGLSSSAYLQPVRKAKTTIEKTGSTVVSSITLTDSLTNPTRARYQLDSDLSFLNYIPAFIDADEVSAQARQFATQRLIRSAQNGFSKEFTGGYLARMVRETFGYKHARAYLQMRPDASISWEDLVNAPGFPGRFALGTGEGVTTLDAIYQLTDRVIEEYENTADGFVEKKVTATYGFRLRPPGLGVQYRYGDDTKSADPEETFGLISTQTETWTRIDKDYTHYVRELKDGDGVVTEGEDAVLLDQPPTAETLDDSAPKRSDYPNEFEFGLALAASQFEQQAMEIDVDGSALLGVRPYNPITWSDSWCQENWQLQRIGQRTILMALARPVTWYMLPNPLIKKGSWWHVRDRRPGVDLEHDVQITNVNFAPQSGAILMQLSGLTWD